MRVAFSRCLTEYGFAVRGEGADAAETIGLAVAARPAICLLAGDLPGGVTSAIAAISAGAPGTRIVVLAERESVAEALECFRLGAAGYLSKDIGYDSLPRALDGVVRGEAALSRTMTRRLLAEIGLAQPNCLIVGTNGRPSSLTLREAEVVQLLAHGSSTSEIARSLSISPITARRHCAEIRRKLGARDRAALVALARQRLVPK